MYANVAMVETTQKRARALVCHVRLVGFEPMSANIVSFQPNLLCRAMKYIVGKMPSQNTSGGQGLAIAHSNGLILLKVTSV
jgi:hypothetical protein